LAPSLCEFTVKRRTKLAKAWRRPSELGTLDSVLVVVERQRNGSPTAALLRQTMRARRKTETGKCSYTAVRSSGKSKAWCGDRLEVGAIFAASSQVFLIRKAMSDVDEKLLSTD
jgi:hypothetical protein